MDEMARLIDLGTRMAAALKAMLEECEDSGLIIADLSDDSEQLLNEWEEEKCLLQRT